MGDGVVGVGDSEFRLIMLRQKECEGFRLTCELSGLFAIQVWIPS